MMNDKLINKDIEKVSVIVDTDDLSQTDATQSRSTSGNANFDYKIKFDENGFGGVFNNVIGFRLKKAIIRNNPVLINGDNSTIQINSGGVVKRLNPTKYGFYTGASWATLLSGSTWDEDGDEDYTTALGSVGTVSYDTSTNKLSYTSEQFDFRTHKESARLLGFNPGSNPVAGTISAFPIDLSNHYVDVVVPEIPSIACKRTASGKNVVERIPMTASAGATQYFICDPADLQSNNYFYPMKLSEITIQLYTDNNNLLSATNEQSSFEFEITILKNNTFR